MTRSLSSSVPFPPSPPFTGYFARPASRRAVGAGKVPAALWELPCLRVVALHGNRFTGRCLVARHAGRVAAVFDFAWIRGSGLEHVKTLMLRDRYTRSRIIEI